MGVSLDELDVWLLAKRNMASLAYPAGVGDLYLVPFNTTVHLAVDEKPSMARKQKVTRNRNGAIPNKEGRQCPCA